MWHCLNVYPQNGWIHEHARHPKLVKNAIKTVEQDNSISFPIWRRWPRLLLGGLGVVTAAGLVDRDIYRTVFDKKTRENQVKQSICHQNPNLSPSAAAHCLSLSAGWGRLDNISSVWPRSVGNGRHFPAGPVTMTILCHLNQTCEVRGQRGGVKHRHSNPLWRSGSCQGPG